MSQSSALRHTKGIPALSRALILLRSPCLSKIMTPLVIDQLTSRLKLEQEMMTLVQRVIIAFLEL